MPRLVALGLAAAALIAGLVFTKAARADIWGYIDDAGRSHLASERVDDRYTLFFKGGVRVDQSGAPVSATPINATAVNVTAGEGKVADAKAGDSILVDAKLAAAEPVTP